jgi:hypothetical protein
MELDGISQGRGLKQPMTGTTMDSQSRVTVPKKETHQRTAICVPCPNGVGAQYVGASKFRTQHGLNELHCV